ncbi:YrdB family protein [Devosia sp.]|uniref:YrdB family protein n=1 Tax=Devosia sp. TaxID=1871048 RepID=UPI003265207D
MTMLRGVNLGLAFALELAMLAGLGVWAFGLSQDLLIRWALVIVVVALATAVWAVWGAPMSAMRLPEPWLLVFKIGMFGATTLLMLLAGQGFWAAVFGVLVALNLGLAQLFGQH